MPPVAIAQIPLAFRPSGLADENRQPPREFLDRLRGIDKRKHFHDVPKRHDPGAMNEAGSFGMCRWAAALAERYFREGRHRLARQQDLSMAGNGPAPPRERRSLKQILSAYAGVKPKGRGR
jgi:hypothetical protein